MRILPSILCGVVIAAVRAQTLQMDPSVQIQPNGAVVAYSLFGAANAGFGVFADFGGGPVDLLGQRFYLAFSPGLTTLASGVLPSTGSFQSSVMVPPVPGLSGLAVFGQAVVLDSTAPNGVFRVSNGASTAFHGSANALVADFAATGGLTGSFASDVPGHVRGGPVTTRTHRTIDPQGVPFAMPLQSPLVPFGCREQMVFRVQDVGATGEPELLTGVRWKVFPSIPVQFDVMTSFELRAGHTNVVPDYTVDPFSALPVAPLSGLSLTFANNTIQGALPQVLYSGAYVIDPAQQLPGGYMPYPLTTPFAYDGVSSLLLEFRVGPNTGNGVNGGLVRLMVQSSPDPFARVLAAGTATQFLVPAQTTVATVGDNTMHDLELVFARVETFCQSPWFDTGRPAPDYAAPIVATSTPPGTSVHVVYRGSASASGATPTEWSPSPNIADGYRHLQFRIVFRASLLTGERPLVDTLVVPFQ